MELFQTASMHLISGWTASEIPAPVTQQVANSILAVQDGDPGLNNGWHDFKALLQNAQGGTSSVVQLVNEMSRAILTKAQDALGNYVNAAWELNHEVPGTRSSMFNGQLVLLQRMSKEAALISLNRGDGQLSYK